MPDHSVAARRTSTKLPLPAVHPRWFENKAREWRRDRIVRIPHLHRCGGIGIAAPGVHRCLWDRKGAPSLGPYHVEVIGPTGTFHRRIHLVGENEILRIGEVVRNILLGQLAQAQHIAIQTGSRDQSN